MKDIGSTGKPLRFVGGELQLDIFDGSDPSNTGTRRWWYRADLSVNDSDAVIRLNNNGEIVDVPVYEESTSVEAGIDTSFGIVAPGLAEPAFAPLADPADAAFDFARVETPGGSELSFHNRTAPGSAIPDSVLLPESDDLTHFDGDTGDFDINSNNPKFNTEFADLSLKATGGSPSFIGSTSGLDNYPKVGDTHRIAVYLNSGTNSLSEIYFGHDSATARSNGYGFQLLEPSNSDRFRIFRYDSGSYNSLAVEDGVGMTSGAWHEVEILHESNGDITATLFDSGGTQLSQLTPTDTTHITDGSYDANGVAIFEGRAESDAYDFWRFI